MKRVLLLLMLALGMARSVQAQNPTVSPAGDLSSLVGVPFDVPLVVDWGARGDKLGSIALRLSWDTAVLTMTGGTPGSFGDVQASFDSIPFGVFRLAGANPTGASGISTVGVGRFVPKQAAGTTMQLAVSELYGTGPNFADVLPVAQVQSGLYCPARGYWGDPDLDHTVGSRDALIALSASVGLDVSAFPESGLADVDADGVIKAKDALVMLSYAVGLGTSGFRLMKVAVGGCGAEVGTLYSITPNGDTLVAQGDNDLRFQLKATAGGVIRVMPDVFWSSSDPNRLAVTPTGEAFPIAPGTVVITGKSGLRDSATATITVVTRRTRHYVDAMAYGAANRLGTAQHPYDRIESASRSAQPGDTVIVLPGRYGEDNVFFNTPVVILGRPSGTNWPVIAGASGGFGSSGINLNGPGRSEVHAIQVQGASTGLSAFTLDTLLIDSLRVLLPPGQCANSGIRVDSVAHLRVRRSTLVGESQDQGCADGIDVYGAHLVELDSVSIHGFGYDGVYLESVDSTDVRRSQIGSNGGYGLQVQGYACCAAPPRAAGGVAPSPAFTLVTAALTLQDSRLLYNYSSAVYMPQARRAALARNVIDMANYDEALYFNGYGVGRVSLNGDSIRFTPNAGGGGGCQFDCCVECAPQMRTATPAPAFSLGGEDWIDGENLDSLVVQNVRVTGADEGYLNGVVNVAVSNSSFKEVTGSAFYFDGVAGPRSVIAIDSVDIAGFASCWQCANGLYTNNGNASATINRMRAANLYYGVYFSDSTLVVTNSAFSDVYEGVYAYSNLSPRPRLVVSNTTVTGASYGIESGNMVSRIDQVQLAGTGDASEGIYTYYGGADTVTNSTVADFDYGIDLEDSVAHVANNVVQRPPNGSGIYLYFATTAADTSFVTGNQVTCDALGAQNSDGVTVYSSNVRLTGNTIAGCYGNIYGYNSFNPLRPTAVIRDNTMTPPSTGGRPGVYLAYYNAEIVHNTITGAPQGGIQAFGQSGLPVPSIRADSNTIQQFGIAGISISFADSTRIFGNLLEDYSVPCCYTRVGGIAVGAAASRLSIVGNTLRRMHGAGIDVDQYDPSVGSIDTAVIVIDTNAVSVADTAVRILNGTLWMRHNNIRNNGIGVDVAGDQSHYFADSLGGNAFQGNTRYAVQTEVDGSINATGNWWGVNGSGGVGVPPGGPGADSVWNAFDGTPLELEPVVPTGIPPLVARPPLALAGPRVTAAPLVARTGTRMTREQFEALRASRPARVARPIRAPHSLSATRLESRRAGEAARVQRSATQAAAQRTAVATRAQQAAVREHARQAKSDLRAKAAAAAEGGSR